MSTKRSSTTPRRSSTKRVSTNKEPTIGTQKQTDPGIFSGLEYNSRTLQSATAEMQIFLNQFGINDPAQLLPLLYSNLLKPDTSEQKHSVKAKSKPLPRKKHNFITIEKSNRLRH